MDPGQDAREVHRADLRPEQAVDDHDARPGAAAGTCNASRACSTQESSQHRQPQQIEGRLGTPARTEAVATIGSTGAIDLAASRPARRDALLRARLRSPPRRDRSRTPIANRGKRNATEPGTHMMTRPSTGLQRREPPESRDLAVVGIEHAVGECQQGRQDRVLHVGQDQVGEEEPGRPSRAAGIRPDDRIPEQERRAEETEVLERSASRSSAGRSS